MKIDGSQQTFTYDSKLWSNKNTFQSNHLKLDEKETKLASYWTLPFTELRLGMKVDGAIRWITFRYRASSLYSLISDGHYRRTRVGDFKWRSLLPKSSLQRNCIKVSNYNQSSQTMSLKTMPHVFLLYDTISCKQNFEVYICMSDSSDAQQYCCITCFYAYLNIS